MRRFSMLAALVSATFACEAESEELPPGPTVGSGGDGVGAGGGTAGGGNLGGGGDAGAGGSGAAGGGGRGGAGGGGGGGGGAGGGAPGGGAGALVATLLRAQGKNDFYFGGTVSPNVWPTAQTYLPAAVSSRSPPST
jgi:hypothetical protein